MESYWHHEYFYHYYAHGVHSKLSLAGNMGQICSATSRVFVQEGVYDKFLDAFKTQVQNVSKVGDPFSEDTFQGPQVTKAQFERVMNFIESGKEEGATLALGGTRHGDKGYFISPTIFADVKDNMTISREEIFGPVVAISKFTTEVEAIKRANDTVYGLGAAIFTENITRAHRVAAKIQAGMVWVRTDLAGNCPDFKTEALTVF